VSRDALLRNPITGTFGCCARAASGHAAALPSRLMKSRLFNRSKCIRCPRKDDRIADWRAASQGLAAVRDFIPAEDRIGSWSCENEI
jgi:hypothetical protein